MNNESKLYAAMLASAMAARTDSGRFGRGRQYVRDGAVTTVRVGGGELVGEVMGSRRTPYEVTVRIPTLGARAFELLEEGTKGLNDLVPGAREIRCTCSCPDGVGTCKHAVAVVLAFADQIAVNPQLLVEWRGGNSATSDPHGDDDLLPVTRPRELRERRMATVHPIRPGISTPAAPALPDLPPDVIAFLGMDRPPPSALLPTLERLPLIPVRVGDVSVDRIVDEALAEIRTLLR